MSRSGLAVRIAAILALTTSATLTVFVPDCFWTTREMHSSPLIREIVRFVLKASWTAATSRR